MRVVKHFVERDDKSDFASRVFDYTLAGFEYPWRYDVFELYLRDENFAKSEFDRAIVVVDCNHPFVRESDEKGIRALILANFFRLLVQRMYGTLPKPVEDVLAYRQMAKRYPQLLEYLAYTDLLAKRIDSMEDFLAANSYWLAFAGSDSYNSEALRKMLSEDRKEYFLAAQKFFAACRDLSGKEDVDKAVAAMKEIACR